MNDIMKIKMPHNVNLILDKLNSNGFEAYIVGGCVRDSIMNREPHDWDICTSALPEQVIDIFQEFKIIPTGLQHGTVTIVIGSEQYEVTTYRVDGEYEDNRHPKDVVFTKDLELDLSRRDFTINAMAYNPNTGLIDIFGGQTDIKCGRIRCVGNAEERLTEDALRILRAIRFAIRYGFVIDLNTLEAMDKCKHLLKNISIERINYELVQMLSYDTELMVFTFGYTMKILNVIIPELSFISSENWLFRLRKNNPIEVSLALFFDTDTIEDIMKRMRFDNKTISNVSNIRKYGQSILSSSNDFGDINYYAKWLLNKIGYKNSENAIKYAMTYIKSEITNKKLESCFINMEMLHVRIQDAYYGNACYELSSLNINGNDVINAGFKGKDVGCILNKLLDMVMHEEISNTKEELLKKMGDIKNEM